MLVDDSILSILKRISYQEGPRELGEPFIKDAITVPFSPENFHPIGNTRRKLCFVDGGNNTVYIGMGRSIQLVKLYYSLFDGVSKEECGTYNFVIDSKYISSEKAYHVRIYDINNSGLYEEELTIMSSTKTGALKEEGIKGIAAYIRRIGEWLLMEKIAGKCDYIVRDGSLQTGEVEEYKYQDLVFSKVNGIIGLSKTSRYVTTMGFSLVAAVQYLAREHGINAPWYYNPLAKNISTIKGDMFIVKLHPLSEYAFRAEIYPEDKAYDILSAIVPHSDDPTFIGYPYGLLDADINARIRDEEVKLYRNLVSENLDDFSRMEMHALDAHDIISEVK